MNKESEKTNKNLDSVTDYVEDQEISSKELNKVHIFQKKKS